MTEIEIEKENERIRQPTLFVCRARKDVLANLNLPKFKCVACKTKFEGPDARELYQAHRKECVR